MNELRAMEVTHQYRLASHALQTAINALTEAHMNADEDNQLFIAIKLSGMLVAQDELAKQSEAIKNKFGVFLVNGEWTKVK